MTGRWAPDMEKRTKRVLERDSYMCMIPVCIMPSRLGATTVDHIVPRSRGGTHDDSNLRAAHVRCNSRRGNRTALPRARLSRWANSGSN